MTLTGSAPPEAPSYAELLRNALQCFDRATGQLSLLVRSVSGIEARTFHAAPPFPFVPLPLMNAITGGGVEARLQPIGRDGGVVTPVPILLACWTPERAFDERGGRGWYITEAGATGVRQRLARMPAPALVVDGGHEIWAAWRVDHPFVDLVDAARALRHLAVQLESDTRIADDLPSVSLPLAGVIRNWNNDSNREYIEILHADPSRVYQVEHLLEGTSPHGKGTAGATGRARRGR